MLQEEERRTIALMRDPDVKEPSIESNRAMEDTESL